MNITRRKLLASVGAVAATAGLSAFWASRMTSYSGPVSDHFDGTTFFDPDGVPPKTLGEVLRWQFGGGRNRQVWPDWVENAHADVPPPRVTTGVRLSYVGHASWLIQTAGQNILIDPVWSDRVAVLLCRAEAAYRTGHRLRQTAGDRHRSGVARPLRPSRPRHAVEAGRDFRSPRDHAARQ